jgi:hypothetical protein
MSSTDLSFEVCGATTDRGGVIDVLKELVGCVSWSTAIDFNDAEMERSSIEILFNSEVIMSTFCNS